MEKLLYFGVCLLGCLAFCPTAEGARNRSLALPRSQCPPGAFLFQKMCYEYLQDSVAWRDAEASCKFWRGGNLASIHSEFEGAVISSYIKSVSNIRSVWIGLSAMPVSSKLFWRWSDGSDYMSGSILWDERAPNTSLSENRCITFINEKNHNALPTWEQKSCSKKKTYLCKYKAAF